MGTILTSGEKRKIIAAANRILSTIERVERRNDGCKAKRVRRERTFGASVVKYRHVLKMQQKELAARAKMAASVLCQIEQDNVTPTITTAIRIARALGVTLHDLTGE